MIDFCHTQTASSATTAAAAAPTTTTTNCTSGEPSAGPADIGYFEGSMPLLLAVPLGGGGGSSSSDSGGQSPHFTLEVALAVRERMRLTVGAQPHIVVCRLPTTVVDVTQPLAEATTTLRAQLANELAAVKKANLYLEPGEKEATSSPASEVRDAY